MADVQLTLGERPATGGASPAGGFRFMFSVDTASYQTLTRRTTADWASAGQLGRHPARQFTGWDDEITLAGVVFPFWRGGLAPLDDLRRQVIAAAPLLLTDGLGYDHGLWVATELSVTSTQFHDRGVPRRQAFNLTLALYGG